MGTRFGSALLLWFVPLLLSAHPHVFVDLSVDYDAKQQRLHVVWLIDEATSELILLDHDTNRNRRLEPDEAKALLSQEGDAMLFYRGGFFIHPERPVEQLRAKLVGGRVQVTFDTAAAPGTVGIWDEEYLFAFALKHASGIAGSTENDGYYGVRLELKGVLLK